ncbi:MAG: hypothetical protein QW128_06930 [Thermoprotei archaeon]
MTKKKTQNIGKKERIIQGTYGSAILLFSLYIYYFFYLKLPTTLMLVFIAFLMFSGYLGLLQSFKGFYIEYSLKNTHKESMGTLDPTIKETYKQITIEIIIFSLALTIITLAFLKI